MRELVHLNNQLSSNHYTDEKAAENFIVHKIVLERHSKTELQHFPKQLTSWGLVLKCKNGLQTGHWALVKTEIQESRTDLKICYLHPFKSKSPQCSTKYCNVSIVFANQIGILGPLERLGICSTSCMEPFNVFLFQFFQYSLKQDPIYFSCSGEFCNTVLLWGSRKPHPALFY